MRYPAALPALCICGGVAAGVLLPLRVQPLCVLLAASFAGAVLAFVLRASRVFVAAAIAAFASAAGLLGMHAHDAALSTPLRQLFALHTVPDRHELAAVVEGRLQEDGSLGPSGLNLIVAVERLFISGASYQTSGGAMFSVAGTFESERVRDWRAGRVVRFPATLRRPASYLDEGVPNGERALARRGVALVGSIKSPVLVEVLSSGAAWREAAGAVRTAVRDAVAETVGRYDQRSAAIVAAILIGDRAGLDDEVERRLQEAGTYHVIAISGGNIAILAAVSLLLLRGLGLGMRLPSALTIGLLLMYALVVSGGSSVTRATFMAVTYLAAQLLDHRLSPVNAIASAAAVILCLTPLAIVDVGFALTFGASLAIVVGTPLLVRSAGGHTWLRAPFALFAASLCAEAALMPVSAFVFSRLTFAGLVLNFAAIPLMTIVQVSGLIAVGLSRAWAAGAELAGYVAHLAVRGLVESAALVDAAPWLIRRVPPPGIGAIALYYAGLVAAVAAHARVEAPAQDRRRLERARVIAAAVVLASGWWIAAAPTLASTPSALRVTFLDVGQGDAALVRFPNGRTLMVDTGGLAGTQFDIGSRVVAPALWALGTRRLDYLAVTHGDADHIGGALSLVRDFRPLEIWEGIPVPPHEPLKALRRLAAEMDASWRTLRDGDRLSVGGVGVQVRHPSPPDWERQRVRNDDSIVLEIVMDGVSFVLTGDIGKEVEQALAPGFDPGGLRVLKVPHHGSASSSAADFVRALRPAVAVISAGRGNFFGHPAQAVLERYRASGAAIFRTDQDGAVMMETDGRTLRVRTYTRRRLTLSVR